MGSNPAKQNSKQNVIKQQPHKGDSDSKQQPHEGDSDSKQQPHEGDSDKRKLYGSHSTRDGQDDEPVDRLGDGSNEMDDQSKGTGDQKEFDLDKADINQKEENINENTKQEDLKTPGNQTPFPPKENHPLDKDFEHKGEDANAENLHQVNPTKEGAALGLQVGFDHNNDGRKIDNADKSDGNLIRGLPNIQSSSCYISSLIQVLAQTPGFIDKLFSDSQNNHMADTLIKIFVEINDWKYEKDHTDEDLYSLVSELQTSLSKRDESYKSGIQNDCHSLYLCLINALDEEIKGSTSLFDGQTQSIFMYSTCDHVEESPPECIRSLLLTVDDNQRSVEDSLERLDAMVTIDDAEVPCRICLDKNLHHEDTQTYKQCLIKSPPEILVLQLARFKQDGYGKLYKYEESVHYPSDLSLRVSRQGLYDRQCVDYDLYGVICHEGNLEGGHYWCYVKKNGWNPDNHYLWHLCADSYVRRLEVNEEWPCSPFAYLLFYKKSKSSQDV